ncbi:response regulator transcription factor, partial [Vibrio cholerae]|nr:response regulator transcription factor [Vibrio cholerae]
DNLDHIDVKEADILFIDVQGVGVSLGFKDEGLGLVEAIKEKYPSKKVIIYSVVSQGDRFHNAFNVCDGQLSKDADPYQFQRILEKFAFSELYND